MKNDDAEDSEEEGGDDEALAERKVLQTELTKQLTSSKQPTGRVVGIIKRNWRSCVSPTFTSFNVDVYIALQLRVSYR